MWGETLSFDQQRQVVEEQEDVYSSLAEALMDATYELMNFALWAKIGEHPRDFEAVLTRYGKLGEDAALSIDDYVEMSSTLLLSTKEDVYIVVYISTGGDSVYVDAEVKEFPQAAVSMYLDKDGDFLYLAVGGESVVRHYYEYPPASVSSALFFVLNPKIEKQARDIASRALSDKGIARLETWRALLDCARKAVRHVDEQDASEIFEPLEVYGRVDLRSLDVAPFAYMEAAIQVVGESNDFAYKIAFYKNDKRLVYVIPDGDEKEALEELLRALTSRKAAEALKKEAERVLAAVRRAYTIMRVLEKLEV